MSENQIQTMPQAPVRSGVSSPGAGMVVMSVDAMIERVRAVHEILDHLMIEGHHYHTFGTTKRKVKGENGVVTEKEFPQYSLGKPGAELICLTFGLAPDLTSDVVTDDPNAPRTIQVSEKVADPTAQWGYKKVLVDRKVTGYYEVKSTCTIWDRSGVLLARASGSCNSCEASFQNQGYSNVKNSILKRSEKRAMVAAVLMASGAGDVFVQDLEDLPADTFQTGAGNPAPPPVARTSGGAAASPNAWMTEGQKKLIFVKGKNAGYSNDVINHMQATLDGLGKDTGRKYFDVIAKDGPEAPAKWEQAKNTVENPPAAASVPDADRPV